ncbi:MAG TPA: hypothetical protein VFT72_12325 [Opitutaceae bacterium]|nr:hypothetical protein [Opitutaceae bacterium]
MSATYVLATDDPELLRAWWVLVPTGRQVLTLEDLNAGAAVGPEIPAVLVLDSLAIDRMAPTIRRCPTIAVGEPGSSALDRTRSSTNTKAVLSYEESRTQLAPLLPLIEEIAERATALELINERPRNHKTDTQLPVRRNGDSSQPWEYIESMIERLGSRARVLDEFRRIVRVVLNTSSATFFLRDPAHGFRADRGDATCPLSDPLCAYWASYPSILDGVEWPAPLDAMIEVSIKQRIRQWAARLLVPMHENGRLHGFMALGVRDDGQPFDLEDRSRALRLARLLRQCLEQSTRLGKLSEQNERWRLAEHYLPNVLVLGNDEPAPKHVPQPVRGLIAEVRQSREARRLHPAADQPYRASAGLVSENLGVWVHWEDASSDVRETVQQQRAARLELLRDIALTLNHELGNALVSLTALRHNQNEGGSTVLLGAIKRDIASLETINRHLASLPTFGEVVPEESDLRAVLREVSKKTGVQFDNNVSSVVVSMVPRLVEFAIDAILESIAENRPELGKRDLSLRLRLVGDPERPAGHISIRGPKLALEGILPQPVPGDVPNHGRISVFIAKEIIRLHGGDVRATQTTMGTEISIVVGSW